MVNSKEFVFIDQSNEGKVASSNATRRQIRKQAMRDAGLARKQRGGYGQHNLRQYPVFVSQGVSSNSTSALANAPEEENEAADANARIWKVVCQWNESIPTKMPIGTYEKLRRDLDFDITELSLLTSLSFGRGAARALASQPAQLAGMLLGSNSSYLNFVPTRYEENPLLRDVLFCTAAQSRWLLRPQSITAETAILASYGNALQRLQRALTDPEQCLHPDVLCATQVLGLFEVLKFSRAERWQYHVAGASHIIQNRGPARFKSEYEKALFVSQVGAIFSESMLNNEDCFLDQADWKPVVDSLVLHDVAPFADRSRLSVELWSAMWPVPRLWKQVTELICHREKPDPGLAMELTLRAYQIRANLKKWLTASHSYVSAMPSTALFKAQSREVVGLCLAMRIVVNRLIVCLSPRTSLAIEQEAQDIANAILGIKRESLGEGESGTRCLLLTQRFAIADSAVRTRSEWEEACRNLIASSAVATRGEWEGECLAEMDFARQGNTFESYPKGVVRPQWQGMCEEHMAESVISTADEYQIAMMEAANVKGPNGNDGRLLAKEGMQAGAGRTVIPKWVFERWCNTLGRKTS